MKRYLWLGAVLLVFLFATFVWPTRYATNPSNFLMRTDRLTGDLEIYYVGKGWTSRAAQ